MPSTQTAVRPRIEGEREAEILTATAQLLCEVGYDKLTFDQVAQAARASKATLYRRWPNKADLVMDALTSEAVCPFAAQEVVDTGSLAGDLEATMCGTSEVVGVLPGLIASVAAVLHRDPELTDRFHDQFLAPRRQQMTTILQSAQRRGELGPDADLRVLGSVMPSAALAHLIETGKPPSDAYMRTVLQQVLLPACAATLQ